MSAPEDPTVESDDALIEQLRAAAVRDATDLQDALDRWEQR